MRYIMAVLLCSLSAGYAYLSEVEILDAKNRSQSKGFQGLCDDWVALRKAHKEFHKVIETHASTLPVVDQMKAVDDAWQAIEVAGGDDMEATCQAAHNALHGSPLPEEADLNNAAIKGECDAYRKIWADHDALHQKLSGSKGGTGTIATDEEAKVMKNMAAWDAAHQSLKAKVKQQVYPYVFPLHAQELKDIYDEAWRAYEKARGNVTPPTSPLAQVPSASFPNVQPIVAQPTLPKVPSAAALNNLPPQAVLTHPNPYNAGLLAHADMAKVKAVTGCPSYIDASDLTDDQDKEIVSFIKANTTALAGAISVMNRAAFRKAAGTLP